MNRSSQETEVKFYAHDLEPLEECIRDLGAQLIQPRQHELNLRFDLPDGSLQNTEKVLRLRQDESAHLTYKGPSKHTDGVLSRVEYEVEVEDFDTANNIIEALGFTVIAVYEKYRTTYKMGQIQFMLDELPYGNFIEIESPDVNSLREISERLGIDFSLAIPTSYLTLFARLCERIAIDPVRLTFESLEGTRVSMDDLGIQAVDV